MKRIDKNIELDIIDKYITENLSMSAIGKIFSLSNVTILNVLKRYNIETRTRGGKQRIPIEKIMKLYYEDNMTLKEIGDEYNISLEAIRLQLMTNGIYSKKELNQYTNKSLKTDYFSIINSSRKAYYIGFLAADGNIYNNSLNFELKEEDRYILDSLNIDMCNNRLLTKHKGCFCFSCKSKSLVRDLSKYQIVPNKTFTIQFGYNIPKEYMSHYIRGLIDGDGWTTSYLRKTKNIMGYGLGFCGNYNMVNGLHDYLVNELNITNVKVIKKKNIYQVLWSNKKDIKKIRDYIYKDADLYLYRKYDKIKDL